MGLKYRCPKCEEDPSIPPEEQTEVVYVNATTVPEMICPRHNEQLKWVENVGTEWAANEGEYRIAEQ
jgi:hypothetical protein